MRLNRFLAQSGLCSRREADDFITAGLVTVNGQIVTQLGTKVLPTDEVKFNDSRVQGEKKVYLVLNKPKGYVTSLDDPHAGKTVMDLVEGACTERIYPVGRLDKNSLGLLLFTNDGDLTKQLTHPSYLKKKIYQVTLDKPLARADMDRIAEGITLEDGEIFADEISYVKENKQEIGIEIPPAATVSCAVFSNSWATRSQTRPCLLRRPDQEEPQARSLAFPLPRGGRTAQIRPVRISPCIPVFAGGMSKVE